MKSTEEIAGYRYEDAEVNTSHAYLLPALRGELARIKTPGPKHLFDLGCGNGSVGALMHQEGWEVTGVDPSAEGIAQAKARHPHLKLETGSAYDDLVGTYGRFPVVISLEVVEHVYAPRDYARTLADLLQPGGTAIISTPYHGYLKNLARR
jgi:2-polyprenyl-6-hydroxyphenyl methylase/3-demethylubiquinone-9 3-methyltransferase